MISTLFSLFSFFALFCALMVIRSKNPVHSVLYLILVFCNVSGLLLLLDLDFFAMVFLVVYVGAIAVLFLFVVMMLDIRLAEIQETTLRYLPIGGVVGCIFFLEMFVILQNDFVPLESTISQVPLFYSWGSSTAPYSTIESLGLVLYTTYVYYFIVASLILLVAMIGAIVLTMHKGLAVKRQNVYSQNVRDCLQTIHKIRG